MTKIPRREWLSIEAYRDFYDHPRVIVAKAASGLRWLLDNKFNDDTDEYELHFGIDELSPTQSVDDIWKRFAEGAFKGEVRVSLRDVEFDPTRRSAIIIND